MNFERGAVTSGQIQIDHIIPLAAAHDLGAWSWPLDLRIAFANDPIELIAVDQKSNQAKKAKLPDQWMPENASFHCAYVRQIIIIARKYDLPIPKAAAEAMNQTLEDCA